MTAASEPRYEVQCICPEPQGDGPICGRCWMAIAPHRILLSTNDRAAAAATAREISAAVKAALARDPEADVLYVHDEAGQPIAALIPIEVWRRELALPEPVLQSPFDSYTHGHIAPEDDDA